MKKKDSKTNIVKQITEYKDLPNINEDFKQINDLVKLLTDNNLSEISFEKGDYKLTLKQKSEPATTTAHHIMPPTSISSPPPTNTEQQVKQIVPTPKKETNNLITIKSPMIGTFYLKPSPDKPPFVEIGSEIAKGQVLCLVEAMKLFNEIESDVEGKIVRILIENSSPVEYDQALFLVEPKS